MEKKATLTQQQLTTQLRNTFVDTIKNDFKDNGNKWDQDFLEATGLYLRAIRLEDSAIKDAMEIIKKYEAYYMAGSSESLVYVEGAAQEIFDKHVKI